MTSGKNKKVLFMVAHRPGRSPGQRFRFEQYLRYFSSNGFDCGISYLISEKDDNIFYSKGRYIAKLLFIIKSLIQRFEEIRKVKNNDIVFLYREAHMLGTTFFEKKIRKSGVKLILDFDDSIWLKDVSNGNRKFAFLKRPQKTSKIIALSDAVIVGNEYLASYARRYSKNVYKIPTTIDTDYYVPAPDMYFDKEVICIGWTGSSTTIKHFALAVPILKMIKEKYGKKVVFMMISDEFYDDELEDLTRVKWNKDTEVLDLQKIDIGIMPLPDDDWSKGKCGFKGLQYMALGIPAVMSPVGVNTEIIRDGINGFLASTSEQWVDKLGLLIESVALRKELGEAGRNTVVEKYSVQANKDKWLRVFNETLQERT